MNIHRVLLLVSWHLAPPFLENAQYLRRPVGQWPKYETHFQEGFLKSCASLNILHPGPLNVCFNMRRCSGLSFRKKNLKKNIYLFMLEGCWIVTRCFLSCQRWDVKPVRSAQGPSLSRVSWESRRECLNLLFSYFTTVLQMLQGFPPTPPSPPDIICGDSIWVAQTGFMERGWNLNKRFHIWKWVAIPPSVPQNKDQWK